MTGPPLAGLTADNIVDRLEALFEEAAATSYLGEAVTLGEHMLQTAACARRDGADDALVAAALLHDIGWFARATPDNAHETDAGRRHDRTGGGALAPFFPAAVTEPIRLHVEAKRWLCAVEPGYRERLSAASRHTMALQGGPMTDEEAQAFARNPHGAAAIRLRRWDDEGKNPDIRAPGFAGYRSLLKGLLRSDAAPGAGARGVP